MASGRSSRHETLWNTRRRFARSAGRLLTSSRTNVHNRWLACMDGRSSRSSHPLRSKTRRGLRSPRAAECAGLRNKSADLGGAMRSADLWAARRGERPWREPPAYADRISRNTFDSSYSRNRDSSITVPSRACMDACGAYGMSGMGSGSLRRELNLSGKQWGRSGGALWRVWIASTGCRSM